MIRCVNTRNILTKSKLPDADFVINPYIGCTHGCVYCYAEYMARFFGHAHEKWGSFLDVKEGYKLPGGRKLSGKTVLIGSSTDPYNPAEKKWGKTRLILEALAGSGSHVEILTKSALVLRDIDLLADMPDVCVGISLSGLDPAFARLTEPYAASPERRIEAIRRLHEARVPVYTFLSPIFPYFTDYRAIAQAVEPFSDFICFENLNLRGAYKTAVLDLIEQYDPDRAVSFRAIYQSRESFNTYWKGQQAEIEQYMRGKRYRLYFFHDRIKKAPHPAEAEGGV